MNKSNKWLSSGTFAELHKIKTVKHIDHEIYNEHYFKVLAKYLLFTTTVMKM